MMSQRFDFNIHPRATGPYGFAQHGRLLLNRAGELSTRLNPPAGGDGLRGMKPHQHLVQLGFKIGGVLEMVQPQFISDGGPAHAHRQRLHRT